MNKLLVATTLLTTLSLPTLAQQGNIPVLPSNFSYNYVEVDYVDFDGNLDGFNFEASYDISQNINVIGSLGLFDGGSYDATLLSGGAAYHFGVGQAFGVEKLNNMDLMIHAELEYIWYSNCDGKGKCKNDNDDLGIYTGVEARYQVLDILEVYADLSVRTTSKNDLILSSGVRFSATETILITAGFELGDNDAISLGGRFNF